MNCPYNTNDKLDGCLHYLFKRYKLNYYKIVQATASSQANGCYANQSINFDDTNYWLSEYQSGVQYLTIFLPYHYLSIDGYLIRSSGHEKDGCHPKQWSFAVSSDGTDFIYNETFSDTNNSMNLPYSTKDVHYQKGKYKYFRLYTLENYCDQVQRIDINQIELFGTLYSDFIFTGGKNTMPNYLGSLIYIFILNQLNKH